MKHCLFVSALIAAWVGSLIAAEEAARLAVDELKGWLGQQVSADELAAWPALSVQGGDAFRTRDAVLIHLTTWPDSGQLALPRLNNPVGDVFLLGLEQDKLTIKPEPREWLVALPPSRPAGAHPVVVVRTVGPPHLPSGADIVRADDQHVLVLPAHRAVTHGKMLRYEPQPHKNTVGYWTEPADWAQWIVQVDRPGVYELRILQGCGTGQGGSEVGIHLRPASELRQPPEAAAPPDLQFVVKDTGHFQNFEPRSLGSLRIAAAGEYSLELRPRRLAAKAVMDVREIRLVPQP